MQTMQDKVNYCTKLGERMAKRYRFTETAEDFFRLMKADGPVTYVPEMRAAFTDSFAKVRSAK